MLAGLGCGRSPVATEGAGATEGAFPCADDPSVCSSIATLQRAVDVLFVIDNSGSMGDKQGTLAANFPAFIDVLERQDVGASYRIGVTSTDRRGLQLSSCRERLDEFIVDEITLGDPPVTYSVDAQVEGCLAACVHEVIDTHPTRGPDGTLASQPWLEKAGTQTNLVGSPSIAEALACVGPQGITGSGFESPLESMRDVLGARASGFMRDEALLAVIFLTDEADCSASPDNHELLQSAAGGAFWTDPERPTSAVCWRAGVACEGAPPTYAQCSAQDKDLSASPTTEPDEAVLYPVDRYVDALRDIARAKEAKGGNGQALVAVIAGVPEGYAEGESEIVYRDSQVPGFDREYGIGPGCDFGNESILSPRGLPPVRLRQFAEAFATEDRNMFSICSSDYAVALEQIAVAVSRLSVRACVPGCVADGNADIEGLQPRCTLTEERANGERHEVPPCVVIGSEWKFPGESVEVCYRALSDQGSTPTGLDDLSAQCLTRGSNLEFVIEHRRDADASADSTVRVDCELTGPVDRACVVP